MTQNNNTTKQQLFFPPKNCFLYSADNVKMSGRKFVEALSRLGYPGATELDGDSFDWIFEFENVVPFLDWFCDEVQAENPLDPGDIQECVSLIFYISVLTRFIIS
jgi:hypothetical protein